MVTITYFPTVITANGLTLAAEHSEREQHTEPISDIWSIEYV
jgi:hypothetical protein